VRNINSPDLGGSSRRTARCAATTASGAGPGMEVLDEGLRAAKEAERNSSAGS
jgi:hypothetical protein